MVLNELAPGKVTLRWAVQKVSGLWMEVRRSGVLDLEPALAPTGRWLPTSQHWTGLSLWSGRSLSIRHSAARHPPDFKRLAQMAVLDQVGVRGVPNPPAT